MERAEANVDPERLLAESSWVRALAASLVAAGEVDDVVQETWRIALERPPRLDSSNANLRGWLATVLRNLVRRSQRAGRAHSDHLQRVGRELASREVAMHERVLLQRRLADAVLQLDEPYKSAIVMRYFEGLSAREIASAQSVSYDAARQRLSRGLAMLRARLDREYGGGREVWGALCVALARRKAEGAIVVGGVLVSVKSLTAVAAVLVLATTSWWWWRSSGAAPASELVGVALPDQAIATITSDGSNPIENAGREVVSTGELTIDRDRDLHGIVLDPDGAVVVGAHVEVLRNELCEISSLDPDHKFDCTTVAKTTTTARGEFAVALPAGRAFDLAVEAAGFARASFEHCHAGERVEVRLERGSTLAGRVTRRVDGVVLAGARVELGRRNTNTLRESTPRLKTTADELGRYSMQGLASGDYLAWVFAAGTSTELEEVVIAPASTNAHDFVLESGRAVSGRVVDAQSGAGIANAEIDASSRFECSVRSDSSGAFSYARLKLADNDALYVRAVGYGRTELALRRDDADETQPIEIRMERGRIVRGRAIDVHGAPLADIYVAAVTYKQGPIAARLDWQSARTNVEGRFELVDIRQDAPHVLWIRNDGLATLAYTFPNNESESTVIDFGDIRVAAASTVRGVLVDENEQPFAQHVVHLRGWNSDLDAFGGVSASHATNRNHAEFKMLPAQGQALDGFLGDRSTRTDDLGRFSFSDLGAGAYSLAASMPHAFHEEVLALQVGEDTTVDRVKLLLPRGPSIEGRVVGPDGEPLYAFVTCYTVGPTQGNDGSCRTDSLGHFKVEGLSPMEYCVAAVPQRRTGELSKTRWLQVTLNHVAAGTHDLEFVCPRGGVITGKVVDSHGDPVQWMQIFARGCDDRRDHGGDETDARGEFEFGVPDDQSYDIRASPLRPDPNNPGDVLPIPDNRPEHTVEMFGVTPSGEPIVLRLP